MRIFRLTIRPPHSQPPIANVAGRTPNGNQIGSRRWLKIGWRRQWEVAQDENRYLRHPVAIELKTQQKRRDSAGQPVPLTTLLMRRNKTALWFSFVDVCRRFGQWTLLSGHRYGCRRIAEVVAKKISKLNDMQEIVRTVGTRYLRHRSLEVRSRASCNRRVP